MFQHYLAALLGLRQAQELACPAPPDTPVQPAPGDRHGCVAMCMELFPQLDAELDAWEAEHGWLYR